MTTQGSVAVDGVPTFPGLPSEVLRYDITSGVSEIFIEQPDPSPDSFGFVSFLGIEFRTPATLISPASAMCLSAISPQRYSPLQPQRQVGGAIVHQLHWHFAQ